jgi:hypothetical protein
VRQTRCWSLPASVSVVGCKTPWKAARVRSSSLWVPSGRFDRASDSLRTMSRAFRRSAGSCCRCSGCVCQPRHEAFGLERRATGRCAGVHLRSLSISLRTGCCRRQRRQWSSASHLLSRVLVSRRASQLGCRGVTARWPLGVSSKPGIASGNGGLRVAGVVRDFRCGVSWRAIRGTDSEEVATPPSSSTR